MWNDAKNNYSEFKYQLKKIYVTYKVGKAKQYILCFAFVYDDASCLKGLFVYQGGGG